MLIRAAIVYHISIKMRINASTDYAIRILIRLSKEPYIVSSSQLSSDIGISSRYVLMILAKLQSAGMVEAERGCAGGYKLAKSPAEITILGVIQAMEGISFIKVPKNDMFTLYANCYNKIVGNLSSAFESITLDDLAK